MRVMVVREDYNGVEAHWHFVAEAGVLRLTDYEAVDRETGNLLSSWTDEPGEECSLTFEDVPREAYVDSEAKEIAIGYARDAILAYVRPVQYPTEEPERPADD